MLNFTNTFIYISTRITKNCQRLCHATSPNLLTNMKRVSHLFYARSLFSLRLQKHNCLNYNLVKTQHYWIWCSESIILLPYGLFRFHNFENYDTLWAVWQLPKEIKNEVDRFKIVVMDSSFLCESTSLKRLMTN